MLDPDVLGLLLGLGVTLVAAPRPLTTKRPRQSHRTTPLSSVLASSLRPVVMKDTDEDLWNRRLWQRLQMIESLETHMGGRHWTIAEPASDFANDDAKIAPFQISHIIGHCLSTTVDFLRSTRLLLTDPERQAGLRLPLVGHYPAIRSAMEAGALALWILGPDESEERISRTLQARWDDIVQDNLAVLALTDQDVNDDKDAIVRKQKMRQKNAKAVGAKKRLLRATAMTAGVPESVMMQGLPGFGEMLGETAAITRVESNHQVGMWRLVSGLTHPSASRAILLSKVTEMGGDDEVMNAELTASVSLTNAALDSALLLHWHTLEMVALRGNKPEVAWKPPPGLPLPPGYEDLAPIFHTQANSMPTRGGALGHSPGS